MPHIRMRGLPEEAVAGISRHLLDELASLCGAKAENFTLEWIPSRSYRHGELELGFTQVEVLWFPKDRQTHHRVEQVIRQAVGRAHPGLERLAVMFVTLDPSAYYRDGQHF
ncbi:DUF1904 domain-containing protein [Shewanella salipaludis]|uniref:DUF1904 domain-containing protein n=1 Tax=Shewanella salipaludis TaxID=2723052 RepID=A0A972FWC8_9GAMM|nr:DUF1904 domain-containing protein [Shewanella salipaludis]NMH63842.1 DUF1904 domain-containing protein [Shewanella salipaludis]